MSEFDHSRNNIGPNYSLLPDPVGWIDTASLEDEVFAAIVTESAAAAAGGDTPTSAGSPRSTNSLPRATMASQSASETGLALGARHSSSSPRGVAAMPIG